MVRLFRTIETFDEGNYRVGDKISFALNDGEKVEALAVKQEDDGMIFYFVDALEQEYRMNRTDSNRIGFQGSKTGTWEWCWLQNKSRNYAAYFCYVGDAGDASDYHASCASGVRPAFKLKHCGY